MKLKDLFRKRKDLRQLCVEEYGEEFGEMYDMVSGGQAIGNLEETMIFLSMIEKVKKENR